MRGRWKSGLAKTKAPLGINTHRPTGLSQPPRSPKPPPHHRPMPPPTRPCRRTSRPRRRPAPGARPRPGTSRKPPHGPTKSSSKPTLKPFTGNWPAPTHPDLERDPARQAGKNRPDAAHQRGLRGRRPLRAAAAAARSRPHRYRGRRRAGPLHPRLAPAASSASAGINNPDCQRRRLLAAAPKSSSGSCASSSATCGPRRTTCNTWPGSWPRRRACGRCCAGGRNCEPPYCLLADGLVVQFNNVENCR